MTSVASVTIPVDHRRSESYWTTLYSKAIRPWREIVREYGGTSSVRRTTAGYVVELTSGTEASRNAILQIADICKKLAGIDSRISDLDDRFDVLGTMFCEAKKEKP